MRKTVLLLVCLLLPSLLLAAPARAQSTTLPADLLDRDWYLISIQSSPQSVETISGTIATIRFGADNRIAGSGGCNTYGGTYTAGANQSLSMSQIVSTRRACQEPAQGVENRFFAALGIVTGYTSDGAGRLQLSVNNGAGLITLSTTAPAPTATATPAPTATPQVQSTCFAETGHCVSGRFLEFWRQNGGLAVFGFPLSDQLIENGQSAQYFERQRFELHPENQRPYDVLLGRLGDELLRRGGVDWYTLPKASTTPSGCVFFRETGHNVCDTPGGPSFLSYWRANGLEFTGGPSKTAAESLALFGLPLSEPMEVVVENRTVVAQWFERARFEWHPENPAAYRVLLGRLGAEVQGTAPPVGMPDAGAVSLTNANNSSTVNIAVGKTLIVTLPSNRSAGFAWQVGQINRTVLQPQGEPQYTPPANNAAGAAGTETFRFTASANGQTTLALSYGRTTDQGVAPISTFVVLVTAGNGQNTPAGAADVTLTQADSSRAITLNAGQTLAVRLDANPSTGYTWIVTQNTGGALQQQAEPFFTQPADAPPGTGGAQTFTFRAVASGQAVLALVYKQPFQPDTPAAELFAVTVTVP